MSERRVWGNLRLAGACSTNTKHRVMKVEARHRMPPKARLSCSWVVQRCSADTAAMLYLVIVSAKADDGPIE